MGKIEPEAWDCRQVRFPVFCHAKFQGRGNVPLQNGAQRSMGSQVAPPNLGGHEARGTFRL